jgi:hypothetical protein
VADKLSATSTGQYSGNIYSTISRLQVLCPGVYTPPVLFFCYTSSASRSGSPHISTCNPSANLHGIHMAQLWMADELARCTLCVDITHTPLHTADLCALTLPAPTPFPFPDPRYA